LWGEVPLGPCLLLLGRPPPLFVRKSAFLAAVVDVVQDLMANCVSEKFDVLVAEELYKLVGARQVGFQFLHPSKDIEVPDRAA